MKSIAANLALVLLSGVSIIGCADDGDVGAEQSEFGNAEENVAEAEQPLISTWYEKYDTRRTVWARGPFSGTPRVRYTWRNALTNTCNWSEKGMVPAPSSQITLNVCGSIGLIYKVLNGNIKACVTSTSSTSPTPVFMYQWFDGLASQVNYRVIDQGINGAILDDSGWVPYSGNGCPR